ncbi:MAG: lipocalin-like domain-containing protein [Thermodesulfobacteriota bacterium]
MKKKPLYFLFPLLIIVFTFSSCEKFSGFVNPFTGDWKSGLFTFTFNSDKTFILEIGSALSFKSEGTYEYDKENIYLSFPDSNNTTFKYKINENKTELFLTPQTEFKWFKTTLKFNKAQN